MIIKKIIPAFLIMLSLGLTACEKNTPLELPPGVVGKEEVNIEELPFPDRPIYIYDVRYSQSDEFAPVFQKKETLEFDGRIHRLFLLDLLCRDLEEYYEGITVSVDETNTSYDVAAIDVDITNSEKDNISYNYTSNFTTSIIETLTQLKGDEIGMFRDVKIKIKSNFSY